MTKFRIVESGTYWGVKEIEAETRDEASEKYSNDPCEVDDYERICDQIDIEEVS